MGKPAACCAARRPGAWHARAPGVQSLQGAAHLQCSTMDPGQASDCAAAPQLRVRERDAQPGPAPNSCRAVTGQDEHLDGRQVNQMSISLGTACRPHPAAPAGVARRQHRPKPLQHRTQGNNCPAARHQPVAAARMAHHVLLLGVLRFWPVAVAAAGVIFLVTRRRRQRVVRVLITGAGGEWGLGHTRRPATGYAWVCCEGHQPSAPPCPLFQATLATPWRL